MFSKPLVYSYDGYRDSVYCITRIPNYPTIIASGDASGTSHIFDLTSKKNICNGSGFTDEVTDIATNPQGNVLLMSGMDGRIGLYNIENMLQKTTQRWETEDDVVCSDTEWRSCLIKSYHSERSYHCIDHHQSEPIYASGGPSVDIFTYEHTEPIHTLRWCDDQVRSVKFNRIDTNILLSSS
uniref:DDB1-and CUL4-associated factor 13 n=1 Tax=Lygus hesperus TaxID=30085 RepID=A0A0A9W0K3_LYGHE